jgi:hypothetical protein
MCNNHRRLIIRIVIIASVYLYSRTTSPSVINIIINKYNQYRKNKALDRAHSMRYDLEQSHNGNIRNKTVEIYEHLNHRHRITLFNIPNHTSIDR